MTAPQWLVDAAVRASFDPERLPHAPDATLQEIAKLRRDGTWILPDSTRRQVLAEAGRERLREALAEVSADLDVDASQRLLRRLVLADDPGLDTWTHEELRVGRSVVRWLSDVPDLPDLPSQELVSSRYESASLLAPLRQAVRGFEGRSEQLKTLMEHVEAMDSSTLVVTGVGGTGKTALLSKLVVDLADRGVKVAYLDLDRADLDLGRTNVTEGLESVVADPRPGMLAAEMARQVAVLASDASDSWLRSVHVSRLEWLQGAPFGQQLAVLVQNLGGGPFVVVLDTFEEAQFEQASGAVEAVRWALAELRAAYPQTRVIIGGRAPVPELAAIVYPLGDLEAAAAHRLFQTSARPTTVSDAEADVLVEHVGGNPLWIVVAGQAVAGDPTVLRDLGTLHGAAAAAFLYHRVLAHVHDVPLPELLEPSLHLRVLRAELLRDVVARAANVIITLDAARRHLARLVQEVALVTPDGPYVRHREDVRALTLVGLRDRDPDRWKQVHHDACNWWKRNAQGPADEAEAAYHALVVWDGVSELDWSPEWARHLGGALLESAMPTASKTFLRNHGVYFDAVGLSPDEQALLSAHRAAAHSDWAAVEAALADRPLNAAGLLLHARALRALRREGAVDRAREARVLATTDPVTAHDAVLAAAMWMTEDGLVEQACELLEQTLATTRAPIRVLQLLDMRHAMRPASNDNVRAIAAVRRAGAATVARDHVLTRSLITWVDDGDLMLHAVTSLGLTNASEDALVALGTALSAWESQRGVTRGDSSSTVDTARLGIFLADAFDYDGLLGFLRRVLPSRVFDSSSPHGAADALAYAAAQTIRRLGLADDTFRRALRAELPRRSQEIDAIWNISAFRGGSGDLFRTIQKLNARGARLPGPVFDALRLALAPHGATPSDGTKQLVSDLDSALQNERHRHDAAQALALPAEASRTMSTLVGAADAAGVLHRLVAFARSTAPAFRAPLQVTWRDTLHKQRQRHEDLLRGVQEDSVDAANHLSGLAYTLNLLGDPVNSIAYAQRALALNNKLDRLEAQAHDLENLGRGYRQLGEHRRAITCHERSLAIAEQLSQDRQAALQLSNLGSCYQQLFQFTQAVELHERALAIEERLGWTAAMANELANIGRCCMRLGEVSRAISFHQRSLELVEKLGLFAEMAQQLGEIGHCYQDLGKLPEAVVVHTRALALEERLGRLAGQASQLGNLGVCQQRLGNAERAIPYHERAIALEEKLGRRERQANQLTLLSRCREQLGQRSLASDLQQRALDLYRGIGLRDTHESVRAVLAALGRLG